jgi:soluble lytic murein transglycosylase
LSKIFKAFLALVAIVVAILGVVGGYQTSRRVKYPVAYADYIVKYATANDLDPYLVMAVIKAESNFVPEAHSGIAGGLMQLTEETAEWNANDMNYEGDYDYMDPETNIMFGCHYLRHLIDIYGNVDTALAAYNGGMGNVQSWLNDERYSDDGETLKYIPFPETRSYVVKVNSNWEHYKNEQE